MPRTLRCVVGVLVVCGFRLPGALAAEGPLMKTAEVIDIGPAWSGIPVSFALITRWDHQFVAYYDDQRRLTVAARTFDRRTWNVVRLPEQIGWDSHNYIAMAVDDDGCIHISANMHVVPLIYFRSKHPCDIHSLQRESMIGRDETKCTYPRFFRGPRKELLFTYRSGVSGNGEQIYNVYDHASRSWQRLLDRPLTSGQGKMNAYIHGPVLGPDGFYHICWVWRDQKGCEFNHDLCYARSRDLIRWETSAGKPLELPITAQTAEVVDPVPVRGGLINGNHRVGFDSQRRLIISYQKSDEHGNTQIYAARFVDGRWTTHQTSTWDYRWEFTGGGSIEYDIQFGPVQVDRQGRLCQSYRHIKYGAGTWILDEQTLKVAGQAQDRLERPAEIEVAQSDTPGMKVRWCVGSGRSPQDDLRYMLRWETLDSNRDKPRDPVPPPSMLKLYTFVPARPARAAKAADPVATSALHLAAAEAPAARKPLIRKLGTIDCDLVETTPIVWKGRLYRFEYIRDNYKPNKTGKSYFRFVDVEKDEPTPAFAAGYHLGSAHVEGDTVYVYGVNAWDGDTIQVFWSKDMSTWSEKTALKLPGWGLFNNSVCKSPGRYIMAFEVGKPPEVVGNPFTTRFAESKDLINWTLIGEQAVYTKDRYSACPTIRWLEGYYYMVYLEAKPGPTYEPYIVRTRDLIHWELSPLNPIMRYGPEDKIIGNPKLTPAQREHIAKAKNINDCDVDFCEFQGKTIIFYCWGNQQGTEFLARAVYDGPLKKFLQGFFP